MKSSFVDLVRAAMVVCEHCKLQSDESVVVYADTGRDPALVESFYTAVVALGADAALIQVPLRPSQTPPPPAATDAMRNADLVFDLASRSWIYTPVLAEVMAERTRILQVLVSPETVIKRPPLETIIDRVHTAAKMLDRCRQIRVTNANGMDLTVQRGTRSVHAQAGYVDQPGMWDSLGMGMVNFCPHEEEAEGTLALNGMMHLSADRDYLVEQPILAQVRGGRITDIQVDSNDARQFADWMASFDDPNMYNLAHVGFGLDHRVGKYDYDVGWESYYGGVILAFGSNIAPSLGGVNRAASHMDSISLGCDLYLDERRILHQGIFESDTGL